jgi:hypothetical protein
MRDIGAPGLGSVEDLVADVLPPPTEMNVSVPSFPAHLAPTGFEAGDESLLFAVRNPAARDRFPGGSAMVTVTDRASASVGLWPLLFVAKKVRGPAPRFRRRREWQLRTWGSAVLLLLELVFASEARRSGCCKLMTNHHQLLSLIVRPCARRLDGNGQDAGKALRPSFRSPRPFCR